MSKNNQVIQQLVNIIGNCQDFKEKSNYSESSSEERIKSSSQCMDEQVKLNRFLKYHPKSIPKRGKLAQLAANGNYQGMLDILRSACGANNCQLCDESVDFIKRHPCATTAGVVSLVFASAGLIFCRNRK